MAEQGFAVLILAAGKATRFKSEHSKVLHRLAGRPLGAYLLETALEAGPESLYMIVGHEAEEVQKAFARPRPRRGRAGTARAGSGSAPTPTHPAIPPRRRR